MQATVEQVLDYAKTSIERITGCKVSSIKVHADGPEEFERLVDAVCEVYGITRKQIFRLRRHQSIVRPRQMLYYFALERLKMRVGETGKMLGQDHTTAIHCRNKIKDLISIEDEETITNLKLIQKKLYEIQTQPS